MLHLISGTGFHGAYNFGVRGPADGFILSAAQLRRIERKFCNNTGCFCGHMRRPDADSAVMELVDVDKVALMPAARRAPSAVAS